MGVLTWLKVALGLIAVAAPVALCWMGVGCSDDGGTVATLLVYLATVALAVVAWSQLSVASKHLLELREQTTHDLAARIRLLPKLSDPVPGTAVKDQWDNIVMKPPGQARPSDDAMMRLLQLEISNPGSPKVDACDLDIRVHLSFWGSGGSTSECECWVFSEGLKLENPADVAPGQGPTVKLVAIDCSGDETEMALERLELSIRGARLKGLDGRSWGIERLSGPGVVEPHAIALKKAGA